MVGLHGVPVLNLHLFSLPPHLLLLELTLSTLPRHTSMVISLGQGHVLISRGLERNSLIPKRSMPLPMLHVHPDHANRQPLQTALWSSDREVALQVLCLLEDIRPSRSPLHGYLCSHVRELLLDQTRRPLSRKRITTSSSEAKNQLRTVEPPSL